jgi:hypothetical protein
MEIKSIAYSCRLSFRSAPDVTFPASSLSKYTMPLHSAEKQPLLTDGTETWKRKEVAMVCQSLSFSQKMLRGLYKKEEREKYLPKKEEVTMEICSRCRQPATQRCYYYHKCGHAGCTEHLRSTYVRGRSLKVCGECWVLLWTFSALDEETEEAQGLESSVEPEDKLLQYASLLEDGRVEEAEALIDGDGNLAESIWPFHVMITNLGYTHFPFPEALRRIRTCLTSSER